jgi:O-antigen/teichoic acid export membrane protein
VGNPDYARYPGVLDLLLLASYLTSINLIPQTYLFSKGVLKDYVAPILLSLAIMLVISVTYTPQYGIIVPPIAILVSYVVLYLVYHYIIRKKYVIGVIPKTLIPYLILVAVIVLIPQQIFRLVVLIVMAAYVIYSERGLLIAIIRSILAVDQESGKS